VTLFSCNARAEVVTIGNTGGQAISLSGYTLHDFEVRHSVSLGQFGSLEPGQQLRLLSGPDASAGAGDVVWTGQNVWNNDGDTAYLIAPDASQQQVGC
jgi:competence protein ComEC